MRGVVRTEVGYANGASENPGYEEVCRGSGHAETVLVEYDPSILELSVLLDFFYAAIDPLSVNHQGPDRGIQYRTGIYYTDETDAPVIEQSIAGLERRLGDVCVVETGPLKNFYPAEEYHQKYLDKNPGGYCHIGKRLMEKARGTFSN
jgi:peptide methionine sulfoxide reductase msrA/msrB